MAELFQCSVGTVRRYISNKLGDDVSEDADLVKKWRDEAAAAAYTSAFGTMGEADVVADKAQEVTSAVLSTTGASESASTSAPVADTQRRRIRKYHFI